MRQLARPAPGQVAGFTLIEVMITVFVTAIGLLTIAGLQAAAKKINFEATQRTVATALAQDMVERIRANPSARSSYLVADATASTGTLACVSDTAVCSAAQIAADDILLWKAKLLGSDTKEGTTVVGGLVDATGCVTQVGTRFRVSIAWRGLSTTDQASSSDTLVYDPCGATKDAYKDSDSTYQLRRVLFIEFV